MKITLLKTGNFKNYEISETKFGPKFNLVFGLNGTGKTNLLDAIHYLGWTKSFVNPIDNQNVRRGEDFFFIEGKIEKDSTEHTLFCGYKKDNGKQFRIDKKEYDKLADHIGFFPITTISPLDYTLIQGGSEERRKFTDSAISVFSRPYLDALIQYNRILLQKNSALKQMGKSGAVKRDIIQIYNEQMAPLASYIYKERMEFISEFNTHFEPLAIQMAGKDEDAKLSYQPSSFMENLVDDWNENFEKELRAGYTTIGPHKDDIAFTMQDLPIRKSASQGQQKTFLTALKLAQYKYMSDKTKQLPVLLLDDIFDKLDDTRVSRLLELLSHVTYGQVIISDTGSERILKIFEQIKQPVELIPVELQISVSHEE